MIFSSIKIKSDFAAYPEAIRRAIDYLRNNDFISMKPGVYEISGKDMYAQVFDAETGPVDSKRPEVHEKYIDVQFLASGRERLGFTPDTGHFEVDERIEERDIVFYKKVENEGFIESVPGCFCVFFPEDVHRPAVMAGSPMSIRKVVVKVKRTLL
jgi:YhcH/YjgK/YiaL family protein